ncbi:MAG: LuxR C-terminal-related transcriptional regulator [Gammaproteobacteria bacterium]|nr:LuxR C-terminal-related transcriptional regulator [Gammaproteobacteria bacterium]
MNDHESTHLKIEFPRLLRRKITIPDRVPGYIHRANLVDRAMQKDKRLTVIKATAGFGKTTLLAECCRTFQTQAVPTAWISVDELDNPTLLDTYIAFACHRAGLDLSNMSATDDALLLPDNRIGLIVRELQDYGNPFVLAFDEIERLQHPDAVALLNFLVQRGPTNLRILLAGREIPKGLDITTALLEGVAESVDTEDLRFSEAEIARFFELRLPREALLREINESAGWPFALRVSRNTKQTEIDSDWIDNTEYTENWVESRLLSDLNADTRRFVLDLSLFDWIEASLVDEVLELSDSLERIESLKLLVGLFSRVNTSEGSVWYLHDLIRQHCADRLFREDLDRFTSIHRRLAIALANRGETLLSMRHATHSGDRNLVGEILENAGGVRVWVSQSLRELLEADQMLSEDVIRERPRLKLVRCIGLLMSGRPHDARLLYDQCPHPYNAKRENQTNSDYAVENSFTRGAMALYGGSPFGSSWLQSMSERDVYAANSETLEPHSRGTMVYFHCVNHFLKGEFDLAVALIDSTKELMHGTYYLPFYVEILHGQLEFIQGLPERAEARYQKAMRIAKRHLLVDPIALVSCQIVRQEVVLERSLTPMIAEQPGIRNLLKRHGMPFSSFATICNLLIDLKLRSGQVSQALTATDELVGFLRGKGYTTFSRLLAALRVSLLVRLETLDEAERAWNSDGFSNAPSRCVDLSNQSWREMEATAEARTLLLIGGERFDEASVVLDLFRSISKERKLTRVYMRALGLSVLLAQRTGEVGKTVSFLKEYLKLYRETKYAWSLLREIDDCVPALRRFLEVNENPGLHESAQALLHSAEELRNVRESTLSERQLEILERLPYAKDKQIAADLKLSVHGVRYHLRGIFSKLGVTDRHTAVAKAEQYGLIAGKNAKDQ